MKVLDFNMSTKLSYKQRFKLALNKEITINGIAYTVRVRSRIAICISTSVPPLIYSLFLKNIFNIYEFLIIYLCILGIAISFVNPK